MFDGKLREIPARNEMNTYIGLNLTMDDGQRSNFPLSVHKRTGTGVPAAASANLHGS